MRGAVKQVLLNLQASLPLSLPRLFPWAHSRIKRNIQNPAGIPGLDRVVFAKKDEIINGFLFIGENTSQMVAIYIFKLIISSLISSQVAISLQSGNKGITRQPFKVGF